MATRDEHPSGGPTPMEPRAGRARSRALRVARRIVVALGLVVGIVAIAVTLLLAVAPARQRLLAFGLARARAALPGALTIQTARWPALGRIELSGIHWSDAGHLLVVADSVRVAADIGALLRRDLHVEWLEVTGLRADVPAVRASFAAAAAAAAAQADKPSPTRPRVEPKPKASGDRFPRQGAVGTLPSIGVDRFRLAAPWLRLADSTAVSQVDVAGGVDLRAGFTPRLRLDHCTAREAAGGVSASSARLELDLDQARAAGAITGQLGAEWPFQLRLESPQANAVHLVLDLGAAPASAPASAPDSAAPSPVAAAPEALHLDLLAKIERDGLRARAIQLEGQLTVPGTRKLATLRGLAASMRGAPDLAGLTARLRGALQLRPRFGARARVALVRNDWLYEGLLVGGYGDGTAQLDSLVVAVTGARVEVQGTLAKQDLSAQAIVSIASVDWLRRLAPAAGGPDSLAAELRVAARGALPRPDLELTLHGRARIGGFALAVPRAVIHAPHAGRAPIEAVVTAETLGFAVDADLAVMVGPTLRAELAPLRIRAASDPLPSLPDPHSPRPRPGTVRYDRGSGALDVKQLSVTGDLGEAELAAQLDHAFHGQLEAHARWPHAPALMRRWVALSAADWDSLSALWNAAGPFWLEASGALSDEGGARTLRLTSRFHLPGPRQLAPLLPASMRLDGLDGLAGNLQLASVSGASSSKLEAALDLAETSWLRADTLRIQRRDQALQLDWPHLSLDGTDVSVALRRAGEVWDGDARVAMADARLLRRFVPQVAATDTVRATFEAHMHGTPSAPDLQATLHGMAHTSRLRLPRLEATVRSNSGRWVAQLAAPTGLVAGSVQLDSLSLGFQTTAEPGAETASPASAADSGLVALLLPGALRLRAAGPWVDLATTASLARPDGWEVHTQTLAMRIGRRWLRSEAPFVTRFAGSQGGFSISDLRLSGDLGSLVADGFARPDSTDLRADVVLLPAQPPPPVIAAALGRAVGVWPRRVEAHVRAHGADELTLTAQADSLVLGGRAGVQVRLEAQGAPAGTTLSAFVQAGDRALLTARGQLPAGLSVVPPALSWGDGRLAVDLTLVDAPIPWEFIGPVPDGLYAARLQGRAHVGGTLDAPDGEADLRVDVPGPAASEKKSKGAKGGTSKKNDKGGKSEPAASSAASPAPAPPTAADLPALQLTLLARLRSHHGAGTATKAATAPAQVASGAAASATDDSTSGRTPVPAAASLLAGKVLPTLEGAGITAALTLSAPDRMLLDGSLVLPLLFGGDGSTQPKVDPNRPLDLHLKSDELSLSSLSPCLPHSIALEGTITLDVAAKGSVTDASLAGQLAGRNLVVSATDGTRATGGANLKLGGNARRPALSGVVEVRSGTIPIPEQPKSLHPTSGPAMLWELRTSPTGTTVREAGAGVADSASTTKSAVAGKTPHAPQAPGAADSAATGSSPSPQRLAAAPDSSAAPARLDLDVEVKVPSGLWVRGRQLDVELSGELRIVQKGAQPTLTGELKAQQGTLVLMGRTFKMDRGVVTFYGDDETNPTFDIELSAKIKSTTVKIHITGTAQEPELELTSEPELSEGDIMAVMVFGETTDNLDGDQSKLVAERAAAIAATYGAAKLESSLAGPLKVDLLTINPSGGSEGQSSVVVGKYLSSNALLKYEQALDATAGFIVSLEYSLTRSFAVEARVGTKQSGGELNWSRDY